MSVTFERRGAATVLHGVRQSGCLKVRFPRVASSEWNTAVLLNTSGGIASGDQLESVFECGPGAEVTLTTQAAERYYRARGAETANVTTQICVGENAAAEWLPQETIIFNGSAVQRRLQVDVAPSARFLGVETLVFGRAAMGETVERGMVHDVISVRRDGMLILHDAVRLNGNIADRLQRRVVAAGARALATVILVAADSEACVDRVRKVLDAYDCGVSAWNGMMVARVVAPSSAELRRLLTAALDVLRAPRRLPRVWNC